MRFSGLPGLGGGGGGAGGCFVIAPSPTGSLEFFIGTLGGSLLLTRLPGLGGGEGLGCCCCS